MHRVSVSSILAIVGFIGFLLCAPHLAAQTEGNADISAATNPVLGFLLDESNETDELSAHAGPDQNVVTGSQVALDGSGSSGFDGTPGYSWMFLSRPIGSTALLANANTAMPSFTPDVDGGYTIQLMVSDASGGNDADTVSVTSFTPLDSAIDTFNGSNPLLTTVNNESALPDVTKTGGRYRANLTDNSSNQTLHFNDSQGRLDAALLSFPFEFIARNIGIGTQLDSQTAPPHSGSPFNFAGVQVHVLDLDDTNSSHVVVGHRGGTGFTIEGKNTLNGDSSVNDNGANTVPQGRADIRIVGNADRTLTVYWQLPNLNPGTVADDWILYGPSWDPTPDGSLPGTAPSYGAQVYVGLITYAFYNTGVPFVGTCDSIEIIQP